MTASPTFDELIEAGSSIPVDGWDFSWFDGRATEERPSWGYATLMGERMADADAALDIQTGGGEVLARIPQAPRILVATESWPPNLEIARRNLRARVRDLHEHVQAQGSFVSHSERLLVEAQKPGRPTSS